MTAKRHFALLGIGLVLGAGFSSCNMPHSERVRTPPPDTADAPEAPPPPPERAFLAHLPPEQTARLNRLGIEVVAPSAVPPDFSVAEVLTFATEGNSPIYNIIYRDSQNRCFAVEFATDTLGDMPATRERVAIAPPMFPGSDYGLNYGHFRDKQMRDQFPETNLFTDWLLGAQGAYRIVGATYINNTFPQFSNCRDISPKEAISLAESLTVITPEILGDGTVIY